MRRAKLVPNFLIALSLCAIGLSAAESDKPPAVFRAERQSTEGRSHLSKPNIILLMADDLGFGDVAYNGNTIVHTPHLDTMAREATRLDQFYAAFPVCSPTRASCLTGRHPFRYGIEWAGETPLKREEITLAEVLREQGYATAHFGKWHVGGLSKTLKQTGFPGEIDPLNYSPPWENGFEECFSTEAMMPTYNPLYHVGAAYGENNYRHLQTEPVSFNQRTGGHRWRASYWTGPGQLVDEWLGGYESELAMDRAIEFMSRQAAVDRPFLTLVWFHTPHTPLVASDEDRERYKDQPMQAQHWFGAISAMDRQIGRLRLWLQDQSLHENTIVWFCSDNGPSYIHEFNSAGPYHGKKATLWEGGVRVPAIIEWPNQLQGGRVINAPMSTSDFYPTLLKAAGVDLPQKQPLLDGIDVMPLLIGQRQERGEPIAFQAPVKSANDVLAEPGTKQMALVDENYKLISVNGGKRWMLFDLRSDPGEGKDLASVQPDRVSRMRKALEAWVESCSRSAAGSDY